MQKISVKPVEFFRECDPSTPEGLAEILYKQAIEVAWLWNAVADQLATGGCLPKEFSNNLEIATKILELVSPGSYLHQRYAVARGATSDQFLSAHTSERVAHAVFWRAAGMLKLIVDNGTADPERWHHFQLCDDERWLFDELKNERMAMLDLIDTGKPCLLSPRDDSPRAIFSILTEVPPPDKKQRTLGRRKRDGKASSAKGEQTELLMSYLTKHHEYENCRVGNYNPAESADISKETKVPRATVSDFLNRQFSSSGLPRDGYVAACRSEAHLLLWFVQQHKDSLPVPTMDVSQFDEGGLQKKW